MAEKTGGNKVAAYVQDIKEILEIVKNIEVQNATRDAQITAIGELAKQNYVCLEGNGKPGIKSDVEKIQSSMKIANWASGLVGGAILLDLITRLLSIK